MDEVVIHGIDDLYARLQPIFGTEVQSGPLGNFYNKVRMMKDPNVCSCKKGKTAENEVLRLYMSIPVQIRIEPNLSTAKTILGGSTLVFKHDGNEISRV